MILLTLLLSREYIARSNESTKTLKDAHAYILMFFYVDNQYKFYVKTQVGEDEHPITQHSFFISDMFHLSRGSVNEKVVIFLTNISFTYCAS